jgi:hypothetical protein
MVTLVQYRTMGWDIKYKLLVKTPGGQDKVASEVSKYRQGCNNKKLGDNSKYMQCMFCLSRPEISTRYLEKDVDFFICPSSNIHKFHHLSIYEKKLFLYILHC